MAARAPRPLLLAFPRARRLLLLGELAKKSRVRDEVRARDGELARRFSRRSALSDTQSYRRICASAADFDIVFKDFRCVPAYKRISENVTRAQGQAYLDQIRRIDPTLLEAPQWFKDNDKYGNPERYDYVDVGLVSPTTLRHVKVAAELRKLFGELRGWDIVEIGGG